MSDNRNYSLANLFQVVTIVAVVAGIVRLASQIPFVFTVMGMLLTAVMVYITFAGFVLAPMLVSRLETPGARWLGRRSIAATWAMFVMVVWFFRSFPDVPI